MAAIKCDSKQLSRRKKERAERALEAKEEEERRRRRGKSSAVTFAAAAAMAIKYENSGVEWESDDGDGAHTLCYYKDCPIDPVSASLPSRGRNPRFQNLSPP